jgi:UDP-N-acetylglucosamine 2-epimerase
MKNLESKGLIKGVYHKDHIMFDALIHFSKIREKKSKILENLAVESKEYYLATVHQAENTDDPHIIKNILIALSQLDRIVVFPTRPRTKKRIEKFNFKQLLSSANILSVGPVWYLDMICLEKNAEAYRFWRLTKRSILVRGAVYNFKR